MTTPTIPLRVEAMRMIGTSVVEDDVSTYKLKDTMHVSGYKVTRGSVYSTQRTSQVNESIHETSCTAGDLVQHLPSRHAFLGEVSFSDCYKLRFL